jgi:hypothetical protein
MQVLKTWGPDGPTLPDPPKPGPIPARLGKALPQNRVRPDKRVSNLRVIVISPRGRPQNRMLRPKPLTRRRNRNFIPLRGRQPHILNRQSLTQSPTTTISTRADPTRAARS